MYSTFVGLETARRALYAQRAAIDITGHNISNVNTPGYRRQRPVIEATPPAPGALQPGTGVKVAGIERMRDQFVDTQIRHTLASLGRWEARQEILEEIQEVFKEPSDIGISAMMDRFWISWQELSGNATDPGRRTSVQQEAISLASAFNLAAAQLNETKADIDQNIKLLVHRVNTTASSIAELNREIVRGNVVGENVADLLDRRDYLVQQLASDVDVAVVEDNSGLVHVTVGGRILVAGTDARELAEDALITGGRIKGLNEAANMIIPGYLKELDDLANALIEKINEQHMAGYDLFGNSGGVFFEGEGAAGIRLSEEIEGNPGLIAAADQTDSPGNGRNALAMAQLKDGLTMVGGTATFRDFYGSILTGLGLETQESMRSREVYEGVLEQQKARQESVSGVSLDEEMIMLIKYSSAFDAAARLVTAVDEMLDRLINGTGLVGR